MSELAARKVADSNGSDADFIVAAFETVLGRQPSPAERSECTLFLQDQADSLAVEKPTEAEGGGSRPPPSGDPRSRARESLLQVLLNHNDFVTIR
jgi:hypothetical protein